MIISPAFHTPEEYFLNEAPAPFDWRAIDPTDFLMKNPEDDYDDTFTSEVIRIQVWKMWIYALIMYLNTLSATKDQDSDDLA